MDLKRGTSGLILVLLIASFMYVSGFPQAITFGDASVSPAQIVGVEGEEASRDTITVDGSGGGDHATIGDALLAAQTGDTILVAAGIYHESPVIDSEVTLMGSGSDSTFLVSDAPSVVEIRARNVLLKGFNITAEHPGSSGAGVSTESTDSCSIENVTISNKTIGIRLNSSRSIIIINNRMKRNGILIEGDALAHWNTHTIDTSNLVNGKMVHYWKNGSGGKVPDDAGQIILTDCTGVSVENQNTSDTNVGIDLYNCMNMNIKECHSDGNDPYGMRIQSSTGNEIDNNSMCRNALSGIICGDGDTITSNECSRNGLYGIRCGNQNVIRSNTCSSNGLTGIYCGDWNELRHNGCESNQLSGIHLYYASQCTLRNNTCRGNTAAGLILNTSNDNTILENDLSYNALGGTEFLDSYDNTVTGNTMEHNADGVLLSGSHSN